MNRVKENPYLTQDPHVLFLDILITSLCQYIVRTFVIVNVVLSYYRAPVSITEWML